MISAGYRGFAENQKVTKVNQAIDSQGTFLEASARDITKRAWRPPDSGGSSVGTP